MKTKSVSTSILAGLLLSLLSAGAATAANTGGNVRMSRIERANAVASKRAEARRSEAFKSEKTDSWLCNYVSPFFCNDLIPTLPTTPTQPPSNPNRGRN
jgi:hypothetical protein